MRARPFLEQLGRPVVVHPQGADVERTRFAAKPIMAFPRGRPQFFAHDHAAIRQPTPVFCRANVNIEPVCFIGFPFIL